MSLTVLSYEDSMYEVWDEFCWSCNNASFLHSMRFISYHQDKFNDQSLMIYDGNRLVALLPAATSINDQACVISHPGITYGGLIHQGWLTGIRMLEVFRVICRHYAQCGFNQFIYKVVPSIYHQTPAQDDIYALFRLEAKNCRTDLSSAIDLKHPLPLTERRRRALKKAQSRVLVSTDDDFLTAFWHVLSENLEKKHGAKPVHSLQELQLLKDRFPEKILLRVALFESKVIAGVLLFTTPTVWHAQYIASNQNGYEVNALDAIFHVCIQEATLSSASYFDFGISNENDGLILNEGLYRFKSEFGGGGVVHQFFEIRLEGYHVS